MAYIYCDATFDKRSRIAFIGYCSEDMLISRVVKRRVNDINGAELSALKMAIADLSDSHLFYSDSQSAVDTIGLDNVQHIPRAHNLADTLVQSAKERAHSSK